MRTPIVPRSGRRSSGGEASKPSRMLRGYESRLERFCRMLAEDAEDADAASDAAADLAELERHFQHALRDARLEQHRQSLRAS